MAKTAWYGTNTHQKEFVRLFSALTNRHSRWTVWSDFVTMIAIEISNAIDESNRPGRSEIYSSLIAKYNESDRQSIALMFCEVVRGLDQNPDQDFLGALFMGLGLSNEHHGQFFTPYNVCRMMAQITSTDIQTRIEERGWISVNDCACGAGALLVAFANECRRQNINYQTCVLFTAQDIDFIVGCMCYIQLSLLGCPGYVVIGDSITNPATSLDCHGLIPKHDSNIWYTPFFFRQEWNFRRTLAQFEILLQPCHETIQEEPITEVTPSAIALPSFEETASGQLSLF